MIQLSMVWRDRKATRLTLLLVTLASLDISKGGKNEIGQALKAQQNVMDEKNFKWLNMLKYANSSKIDVKLWIKISKFYKKMAPS